ncbi:MAG: hypothetical protein H6745_28825 [Deltaproteobacteria bacterium]|nr:hypothetical protein [Deltaproteobacteria bacterium]
MKCPKCGNSHKKKDGASCSSCGRTFVFFPPSPLMTDMRMQTLFRRVTASGTYEVLEAQLYGAYARHAKKPGFMGPVLGLVAGLALGVGGGLAGSPVAVVGGIIALIAFIVIVARAAAPAGPPDPRAFHELVAQWRRAGEGAGLIAARGLDKAPAQAREQDVHDYGVEQVLVVDDDLLVDFLVRNHFHAETRTAVVASSGYPAYVMPLVERALAANAETPVFALHAAGHHEDDPRALVPAGLRVGDHPFIDLGFRVADAERVARFAAFAEAKDVGAMRPAILPPKVLLGALTVAMRERMPLAVPLGVSEIKNPDGSSGSDGGGDFLLFHLDSDFG